MLEQEILLSIICTTYNHRPYIEKTLDGFLMQKTDFRFEVIVHDDASTDKTAEVIREYAKKSPGIIVPILQTENQYSRGAKITLSLAMPRARGKYIALCEGDDYWTDENKLQRQVDFLEAHEEYSACFHAYKSLDMKNQREAEVHFDSKDREVMPEEIIAGGGGIFATNSLMARRCFAQVITPFQEDTPVGDYPLMMHLAFCGKVFYMDSVMSVYRKMGKNSWSKRYAKSDTQKQAEFFERSIKMLKGADEFSGHKYEKYFDERIFHHEFCIAIVKCELERLKGEYKALYSELPLLVKINLHLRHRFPWLTKLERKVTSL